MREKKEGEWPCAHDVIFTSVWPAKKIYLKLMKGGWAYPLFGYTQKRRWGECVEAKRVSEKLKLKKNKTKTKQSSTGMVK